MGIVYLASPYSKGTANVRLARFEAVTQVAAKLVEQRLIVFSPVTMTHPIDRILASDGETLGSEYWVEFDKSFMRACSNISVLMLPGWQDSSGVAREIKFFEERGIAPDYLNPRDYGVTPDNPAFQSAF